MRAGANLWHDFKKLVQAYNKIVNYTHVYTQTVTKKVNVKPRLQVTELRSFLLK